MNAEHIKQVQALCISVAEALHAGPPDATTERASKLLLMTAGHESGGMVYRRQKGFGRAGYNGAFGVFQTEWPPVLDSLRYLADHSEVLEKAQSVLSEENAILLGRLVDRADALRRAKDADPDKQVLLGRLQTVRGDDLATVLARVHYMRDPSSLPESLYDLAVYAKRVYNTERGKATAEQYKKAYDFCTQGEQRNEEAKSLENPGSLARSSVYRVRDPEPGSKRENEVQG